MEFIFTTTVDNAICHIRSYQTGIDPAEVVSQRPHKHFYMEFHCVFSGEEIGKNLPSDHISFTY